MAGRHNIVSNARPGALHAGAARMAKTTNVVVRNVNQANRYSGFYLTRCAVGVASAESGSRINGIKKGDYCCLPVGTIIVCLYWWFMPPGR